MTEQKIDNLSGNSTREEEEYLSTEDEQLLAKVEKDKIEYIRFDRCDLYCRNIGKLIPARYLKHKLLNGIDIPKPSFGIVGNYNDFYVNDSTFHNNSNVKCKPYYSTYNKLPDILCTKANIATIMYYPTYGCDDSINIETREIFNLDPRALCLNQLSKLKDQLQIDIYSTFEHEFQLFHKPKNQSSTELVPVWSHKKCMDNIALSEHEDFLIDCERSLNAMNVNIECMHLELGPGCYEWTMKPSWGIKAGDDAFTYKSIIKQIAMKYKYIASFATTPECDKTSGCSNGAHFNHSLWRDGKNIFYDEKCEDKLSMLAKYWIGGILKHIKGITCFAVPTINCYRRVRNHSWAPGNVTWGFNNRTTMIRVKRDGSKGTYIEYRLSCCACNPYLVLMSIIIAGMDGIKNKILPMIEAISDDANSEKYKDKFERVPQYLGDALEELGKDEIICKGFGDKFIESYTAIKKMEIDSFDALTKKLNGDSIAAEKQMFSTL